MSYVQRSIPFVSPIALAILLAGCGAPDYSTLDDSARKQRVQEMYEYYRVEAFPNAPEVTPEQLSEWLEAGDAVLVDVREPQERAVSMLPGAIDQQEFEARKEELRDRRVVTYCTIGYRSGQYTAELQKEGIDSYNLIGSVLNWAHAGKEFVDPDGNATRRVHVYGPDWDLLPQGYEAEY